MICLNMIVKNESRTIERCLASAKRLIDTWVIVDTGSTDGTQKLIREFLRDIPGELHERPWVDFSHNRNEALLLARGKGDYLLFLDADDELRFEESFSLPPLDKDYYLIVQEKEALLSMTSQVLALVDNRLEWRWEGVLHEVMALREGRSSAILCGVKSIYRQDGSRSSDPEKFHKDVHTLEQALEKEPLNSRYVLYLALSCEVAGLYEKAIENYQKRSLMGGWEEEVFYSLFRIAHLERRLNRKNFIDSYWRAYLRRPSRAEPLYWLADYYISTQNYLFGYVVSKQGLAIPMPESELFYLERFVYEYGLLNHFATCAYYLHRHEEARAAYLKILSLPNVPEETLALVRNNLNCLTPA
ncbi:MAG: glycosyltransferase [Verrucomicrobia bacterium]|nr:glycosyltransferase [Verrucomicrobiota bacterium]